MFSKRGREGYLMIDHRSTDGTPLFGLPHPGSIGVADGEMFESSTITCKHCCRVVVLNPNRKRERGYCPKCDAYVCDQCEAVRVSTLECKTFEKVIEEIQEKAARGLPPKLILPGAF